MAVRSWSDDGSELRVGTVAGSDIADPVFTLAALVKPSAKTDWEAIMSARDLVNGRTAWTFGMSSADKPFFLVTQPGGGTQTTISTGAALTDGEWYVVVYVSRPARQFSVYSLTAGTWVHSPGDLAGGMDTPGSSGYISFGRDVQYNFNLKARMALCAVWDSGLTDGQIEALAAGAGNADWTAHAAPAAGLWPFTQESVSEDVPDVMDNHAAITGAITGDADLNGRTGTAVVTGEDPPDWDLTIPAPALAFALRLAGGAANEVPADSIGGAMSSTVADDVFDAVGATPAALGQVDYRLVYVLNQEEATDGDISGYVSVQQTTPAGHEIALGAATEAADVAVSPIADDTTAPAGVSFSAPASSGAAVALGSVPAGSFKGVWLRRTIPPGTADASSNPWQVSIVVTPQ